MKLAHLFLVLFFFLGMTSCSIDDNEVFETEFETVATDPPLEEAGEEQEIEPNK